jgi:diguanylate cyclase
MTKFPSIVYSPDKTAEYFRLSLAKLGQLKIPITPVNYTVIFYYICGNDLELNLQMDDLFADIDNWSDDRANALFSKFVSLGTSESDRHLEKSILLRVAEILGLAIDVCDSSALSCESLTDNPEKLAVYKNPSEILTVASQIRAETRKLVIRTKQFEQSMRDSGKEISQLKGQLDTARQQAKIDALTGLYIRRGFNETLARLLKKDCADSNNPELLLLDINHFKRVNDTFGHLVADKVLVGIGQKYMKLKCGGDYLSRTGGEEFAILLLDTCIEGAFTAAQNLRKSISKLRWRQPRSGKKIGQIAISIGIVNIEPNGSAEAVRERSDWALHRAKSLSSNCSVIA